jgi:hypothetical protein
VAGRDDTTRPRRQGLTNVCTLPLHTISLPLLY